MSVWSCDFSYLRCQVSLMFSFQLPLVSSQFDVSISGTFGVKSVWCFYLSYLWCQVSLMGGFSYLWCQASLMFLLQLPLVPSQFDIFISATFGVKSVRCLYFSYLWCQVSLMGGFSYLWCQVSLMFLFQLHLVSSQFDVFISATLGVKSVWCFYFSYLWCQVSLMFLFQLPLLSSQFDVSTSATFGVNSVWCAKSD